VEVVVVLELWCRRVAAVLIVPVMMVMKIMMLTITGKQLRSLSAISCDSFFTPMLLS
jgi:hypothetical protein